MRRTDDRSPIGGDFEIFQGRSVRFSSSRCRMGAYHNDLHGLPRASSVVSVLYVTQILQIMLPDGNLS